MKRIALGIFVGVSAFVVLSGEARSATPTDSAAAPSPVIEIDDVARFYQVYDAAGGHPTAEQLQHEYLDPGSEGLHHLAEARRVSGTAIAKNLTAHPEMYSDARRCMAVLPRVRQRLASRAPQIRPALS